MPDPNDPNGNPLTDIAQILASASQGRMVGKQNAGDLLLRQGSLANQMYNSALNAKAMDAALPSTRMSQVARGDFAANAQDVTASGPERVMNNVIHFSGGLRPSAFSQTTRDAGTKLAGIASSAMGNETMPTAPTLPQLPASSLTDSLLSGAAGATGILGALANAGGGGDLGKLLGSLKGLFSHPSNGNAPGTDFGSEGNIPWDLSGVEQGQLPTGVTPGLPGSEIDPMQQYWDWLAQQQGQGNMWGGGGSGDQGPIDNTWHP